MAALGLGNTAPETIIDPPGNRGSPVAADLVVLLHFLYIAFATLGAALAIRWPRIVYVHLPAALWGALVEFFQLPCPLTDLEWSLRGLSADETFVERYLVPILYPPGLTADDQLVIGTAFVAINLVLYGVVLRRRASFTL